MKKPNNIKEYLQEQLNNKQSLRDVALRLDVSHATVRRWALAENIRFNNKKPKPYWKN